MLLMLLVAAAVTASVFPADLPEYRLPGDVIPRKYNLRIATNLEEFVFSGEVDIEIECNSTTDIIKLHAASLSIPDNEVTLTRSSDNKKVAVNSTSLDTDNQFLIINVTEDLTPASLYVLHISFAGNLTDGLAGYYRSSYEENTTGKTKWLAVTQFEPTDARRAFPCFDEPAMKAKFHIRLSHKSGLKSASNMPLLSTHPDEKRTDWVIDEFQESVPMSTYLVAFTINDFEYEQSDPELNNVVFRVWARKEAMSQVEFSRKYGPKFLNYYEDFFGTKYPLPKQDMLAIPDFAAGAMENWGLITYRESQVLVDENTTSLGYKQTIADTVAHELAHQWFGNLVTMKWWTDLWLNEGFATYVASLAVSHQFPEWNSYQFDVASNLFDVFYLDALLSSHPVSVPIGHPDEIGQIFDTISYSKGSLLLHMMDKFLGDDVFQAGVSEYIKKYEYTNTEQDDLWAELTAAAQSAENKPLPPGVTVKNIMDTWTLQTGYPVVTVKRDGGKITVSQKRFLANPTKAGGQTQGCWWIPLTYSSASHITNDTRTSLWLSCESKDVSFDSGAKPDDWLVLNNEAAGIYRVNYDALTWSLLAQTLQSPNATLISELNRLQLVLDAMALAQVGALDYPTAFQILKYIKSEKAYNPWRAAITAVEEINLILWRTEKREQFEKMVQSLLSNIYKRFSNLTSVPTEVEEIRHKSLIVGEACSFHLPECVHDSKQLFKTYMASGTNPIPKDLRRTVYCEGVRQGKEEEWMFIWNQYQTSNIANEKTMFLSALACSEQEVLLSRFLDWSINATSGVRRQDASTVFTAVASRNPLGFKLAWTFLQNNLQRIHDYLTPNTQDLGSYVKVLAVSMVFPEEFERMKKFLSINKKLLEKAQLSVNQGLESAETNLQWMKAFYANISQAMAASRI